jgi:hypothetical protein
VGRNAAIKHYDTTPAGQPLELFNSEHSRRPAIVELLRSPWIVRASELRRRDGGCATKRVDEPVTVEWDARRQCPVSFARAHKRYVVDAIIQVWATERRWWNPRRHVSRRFFRVLSRGGVYDLAFDRAHGGWLLTGIQD